MSDVVTHATERLGVLLDRAGVDDAHGLGHALAVLAHVDRALECADPQIGPERALAVRLAALLHDADDRKLFKHSVGHENAARILRECGVDPQVAAYALRCIALVACSANGDACPPEARAAPELLWPRWADRLEATGDVGVVRCWQYNRACGAPIALESTPRPTDARQVWKYATPERYAAYQASGRSSSMLDHFYDKLLHVANPPADVVRNSYLESAAAERAAPLVAVCLEYARGGPDAVRHTIKEAGERVGIKI